MVTMDSRLDGWKAIAGHFGRERTTVIRWARDRGMPVHALPGGKTRTVYALVSELDGWARSKDQISESIEHVSPAVETPPEPALGAAIEAPQRRLMLRFLITTGVILVVILITLRLGVARPAGRPSPGGSPTRHGALPTNPVAAALLVQARDDWAQRSAAGLGRSLEEFQRVTRIEPHYAPAYADLADSYLLAGEVGSLPSSVVFESAQHASDQALALDPGLASAHRAKGFILYWWEQNPTDAGNEFREALRLDPTSAQTHFWYANVLADDGEDGLATREFDLARLADPGSDQIGADFAWARWMSGNSAEAEARLRAIVVMHPGNAEAQDCLAVVSLSSGNYQAYLNALQAEADLRQDAVFSRDVRDLRTAFERGGGPALLTKLVSIKLADQDQSPYPDHAFAAYYESLAGNRSALVNILMLAQSRHEHWGAAGYLRRMQARWHDDIVITGLIDSLREPPVEQPGSVRV